MSRAPFGPPVERFAVGPARTVVPAPGLQIPLGGSRRSRLGRVAGAGPALGRLVIRRRRFVVPVVAAIAVVALLFEALTLGNSSQIRGATQNTDKLPTYSVASPDQNLYPGASGVPASGNPATPHVTPAVPPTPEPTPPPVSSLTGYRWPLVNARVTLPFGPTDWGEYIVDGKKFHDGVDMATFCGDKVTAAHDGTVLAVGRHFDDFIGWWGDLKPYYDYLDRKHFWNNLPIVVVIDDGNGYRSIYAHFNSTTVKVGQQVKAGQMLGYEGATGHASGCHVHYGLFSPLTSSVFELDPTVQQKLYLPPAELARVNPLLVLPFRHEIEEMRPLRPEEEAKWTPPPATPTPAPSATPKGGTKATPKPSLKPAPKPTGSHRP